METRYKEEIAWLMKEVESLRARNLKLEKAKEQAEEELQAKARISHETEYLQITQLENVEKTDLPAKVDSSHCPFEELPQSAKEARNLTESGIEMIGKKPYIIYDSYWIVE